MAKNKIKLNFWIFQNFIYFSRARVHSEIAFDWEQAKPPVSDWCFVEGRPAEAHISSFWRTTMASARKAEAPCVFFSVQDKVCFFTVARIARGIANGALRLVSILLNVTRDFWRYF